MGCPTGVSDVRALLDGEAQTQLDEALYDVTPSRGCEGVAHECGFEPWYLLSYACCHRDIFFTPRHVVIVTGDARQRAVCECVV